MKAFSVVAFLLFFAQVASADLQERVMVTGAVRNPLELAYTPELTLVKAVIAAGGFAESSHTPVYLVRCRQVKKFDIHIVIESTYGAENNPHLQPWDIVVVGDPIKTRQ